MTASNRKYANCLVWVQATTLREAAEQRGDDVARIALPYPPPHAQTLAKAERRYHAVRPGSKGKTPDGRKIPRHWLLTIRGREWLDGWEARE